MCDDGLKKNNNIINNVSSQVFKSTQHHNKIYMDGRKKKHKKKYISRANMCNVVH